MSPRVAIIGSSGFLGAAIVEALSASNKVASPITVVTRSAKDKTSTDKVNYVSADVTPENAENLYPIFEGVDVLIELAHTDEIFAAVEKVVAHVKPKLVIPSQFGTEIDASDKILPGLLSNKTVHSNNLRKVEGVKVVDVITSLFAVPNVLLYEVVAATGIDTESKTVTYIGDKNYKFAVSKLPDIANTVTYLATVSDYSSIPNKVRVYSDLVSQKDVADRYEQTHDVNLKVEHITKEAALEDAKKRLAGGFEFKDFFFYLQTILSQGEKKGLAFELENEREFVNPKESNWKWEKY